jgi:hypothetical protein
MYGKNDQIFLCRFSMDANIWGSHYWFVIHTIAHYYPIHPNTVTKRKYYDFIQNLPLFIPDDDMGEKFQRLLDKYPVSPYLDNRESFVRWTYFIHNKVNHSIGKEEMGYIECNEEYQKTCHPIDIAISKYTRINKNMIVYGCVAAIIGLYIYNRQIDDK